MPRGAFISACRETVRKTRWKIGGGMMEKGKTETVNDKEPIVGRTRLEIRIRRL